ncbi:hypothetical protein [Shewanella algae]|uniref:hypothetical protein n=1 Tax=Shewanella algae TaxID=38313 RepID=UPI001AACE0DA|nr:hypothetical protein [Shewanella algae]QTE80906.1 hypothetical protein JKK46_14575 [Shewanella algae]
MEELNTQKELFDIPSQPSLVTFRFITNRTNLLTILDAGYVTTANRSWRYTDDSRELYNGSIPLVAGSIPDELKPLWTMDGPDFPVILEFSDSLKEWIPSASDTGLAPSELVVVNGLIPLKYLKRIVFRNAAEREDFIVRSISEKTFGEEYFATAEAGYPQWYQGEAVVRIIDAEEPEHSIERLGSVIAMLNFYEFSSSSIEILVLLVEAVATGSDERLESLCRENLLMISAGDAVGVKAKVDRWLLRTVFDYCIKLAGPDAFTQDQLIEVIQKKAEKLDDEARHHITNWLRQIAQIFDSEVDVDQLRDQNSIIKRAVVLLALRSNTIRFGKLATSSLRPGPRVKLLAACFLGALCGHQNLRSFLQQDAKLYFRFIASVLERLTGRTQEQLLYTRSPEPEGLVAKYELLYQGKVIRQWSSEPDPVLAQVYYQALGANYQLHYNHDHQCLWTQIDLPGGRKQRVYVARSQSTTDKDVVLRFYSPCLGLKDKGAKLVKERLYDLLQRNSSAGMCCRFAIDESVQAVIVAVDQIQSTMDEKELIAHLEHVASRADSYERENSALDFY